ncbi:unnamed protein product [Protopolystoma xenopodis]|uniref:Uncharacterized protein n=1 Tax=Protopolystoma xenopodis TaxID=117903 RepID=A0A3S5AXX0_9PLAT|nr:unnamed protein product [Protopolystoma xenopodis]
MCVSYYNDNLNDWEQLLETFPDDGNRMWTLQVDVSRADAQELFTEEDWESLGSLQASRFTVIVVSRDNLEITIPKTALDLVGKLATVNFI